SLRMDLYDRRTGKWDPGPLDEDTKSRRKTKGWLSRETQSHQKPPISLTSRQIDLLGPVLAFRGLRTSRMWMFDRMGYPQRTARRYLNRMLKDKILRLLYTPALEYCGLPEGLLVVGEFKEQQSRRTFINWMISRLPYVRVFTDKSKNIVAYLRLPTYGFKPDVVGARIEEMLAKGSKKDRVTTQFLKARLRSNKTYQMTVFQRMYQEKGFVDPWEK
ncbi:MAG: hypothetical protein ACW99H_12475, partial [Candidatus Thorarchaeota archaeon]